MHLSTCIRLLVGFCKYIEISHPLSIHLIGRLWHHDLSNILLLFQGKEIFGKVLANQKTWGELSTNFPKIFPAVSKTKQISHDDANIQTEPGPKAKKMLRGV